MSPGNRISGKQTIVGLTAAGIDPDRIRTVFESTPSGRGLLGLLDAGTTVDWIDPVTVATLEKNTGAGKLSDADVFALKSLSRRFAPVTSAECQTAWLRKRIDDRVTNAAALMRERAAVNDTAEQLSAKWVQPGRRRFDAISFVRKPLVVSFA